MSATMLLADAWIMPATHPQSHPCPLLSQQKPGLTSLLMSVCSLLHTCCCSMQLLGTPAVTISKRNNV